jgi:signal transduction histidine kinase
MNSLRVKLLLPFIAGTLTLTLSLAWYTYNSARKAVEDAMLHLAASSANHTAGSMTLLYKSLATALRHTVEDAHVTALFEHTPVSAKDEEAAAGWLETIIQSNDFYRDIMIVDKKGVCVASSNPGYAGISYADKDYVRQALAGEYALDEPAVGRVTKRFSLTAAGPVYMDSGVEGALIIVNDFPGIVDYDSSSAYGKQSVFTAILNPEGLFMAHVDNGIMGNRQRSYPELYRELIRVGHQGGAVDYILDGKNYVGFAVVEPFSNWVVITSGTRREVFASAYMTGVTVLGISLTFLAVVSLVVAHFANGILNSLLSLIGYAQRVSEGHFDETLEDSGRKDELGVLHSALQHLVRTLRAMLLESQEASNMKSQFLANMSHEIRTPLNAIIGMTHLSLREPDVPARQREYMERIQTAAKSFLGIINDILDISKVEAGRLVLENAPFSLEEVIDGVFAIHHDEAANKGLFLRSEYAPDAPRRFVGDPARIGQVVGHLVHNGVKFTQSGGVTLRCRCEELPQDAAVMRVSVEDTGIGIPENVLNKLFQPFTQADASSTRRFGGTGLGLSISQRIVQLLGGTLSVTSKPDRGTVFSFTMRLAIDTQSIEAARGEILSDPEQPDLAGRRILVAEDNAVNQMIMEELLTPFGAEVVMADNGQLAVEAVQNSRFDMVFMDIQMPVMDGLEASRRIRSRFDAGALPIIAVSANVMKEDREKGMAAGMNAYIGKPVDPAELQEALRQWLIPFPN